MNALNSRDYITHYFVVKNYLDPLFLNCLKFARLSDVRIRTLTGLETTDTSRGEAAEGVIANLASACLADGLAHGVCVFCRNEYYEFVLESHNYTFKNEPMALFTSATASG